MRPVGTVLTAGVVLLALAIVPAAVAEAQKPIRIGASLSQTGAYAVAGQNQLRGYQLCVKHTNDKGGLLGRRLELVMEDDRSEPATAVRIYEKLITQDKVNAVLSPYTSPIIDAVAEVSEKHRMPLVAFGAAASAVFKKGRKFLFMVQSPAEVWLEGFVELAARNGLRTIALIYEDSPFSRAAVKGASELARKRGLQVVFTEAYPTGNTEFAAILTKARSAIPDAFGAATRGLDAEAVTRQIKALDMNPKMYAVTIGGALPRFYETLGRNAEFVYVPSEWEPELVTLRAGGLIPIARQYPGARELVEAHHREYPGVETTLDRYGHLMPQLHQAEAQKLDQLVFPDQQASQPARRLQAVRVGRPARGSKTGAVVVTAGRRGSKMGAENTKGLAT
jgi:branched-chain amino acid transport system substrate-binding protein